MNLSPTARKYVYVATVAVMAVALALGVVTPAQLNGAADNAVKVLGALAAILAYLNVNDS